MIWSYSENLVILRKIICCFKIFRAFLILRSKRRRERERGGGEGGIRKMEETRLLRRLGIFWFSFSSQLLLVAVYCAPQFPVYF